MIGRYWTGLPYTPTAPAGTGTVGASAVTGILTNSQRLPDQKIVDISINKTLRLSSQFSMQLFLNVYNLFDQRDATTVYTDTGSADYTTQGQSSSKYDPNRLTTVGDFVNQESWYTAPRQIQLGLALGFN